MHKMYIRIIVSLFLLLNIHLVAFAEGEVKHELPPTMAEYQEWLKKNGHHKKPTSPPPLVVTKKPVMQSARRDEIVTQEDLQVPVTPDDF